MQDKLLLDNLLGWQVSLVPYAIVLVFMGLLSVWFIGLVIKRQLELFKLPIAANIVHFRKVLFGLAVVVLVGNVIPLLIDLATIFYDTGRPPVIPTTSLIYSLVTHLTLITASYLIYRLYRLAADVDEKNDDSEHLLINEDTHKKERKQQDEL